MKVLFVLDRYDPDIGGSEKLFKLLIDELQKSNVDYSILCCKHPDRESNPHLIEFPFRSRILFAILGNFWVLFHSRKADLIHSSSFFSGLACSLACLLGKKAVLTYHEVWLERWRELPYLNSFQKWQLQSLERLLIKVPFQRVVGVSEFTSQALLGIYPHEKVRRVLNALGGHPIVPEKDRGNNYLVFGRLGVSKGWHLLRELKNENLPEDFKLQVVLPKQPKWLWDKIDPELNASFIEVKDELPEDELFSLIQEAKAVLVPSVSEGFGFAAAETCALGTAVIHSGRGALPEVTYGKVVVMEEYSGKGLADAIWKFERGEVLSINKKSYRPKEMADAYIGIYHELLS